MICYTEKVRGGGLGRRYDMLHRESQGWGFGEKI